MAHLQLPLRSPRAAASLAGPDGSVYFSGLGFNSYIGRITPDGIFHRIAGRVPTDPKGSFAEGTPALLAGMNNPSALAYRAGRNPVLCGRGSDPAPCHRTGAGGSWTGGANSGRMVLGDYGQL